MGALVPAVEVADHADSFRVGRPHGEVDPRDAFVLDAVRAEHLISVKQVALAPKMPVEISGERPEAVRIVVLDNRIVVMRLAEPVAKIFWISFRDEGREQPV